jgi:hypothetical protein
MKKTILALSIASLLPVTAGAVDGRVSGFATVGVASTDSAVAYDRGLDKHNTEWVNDTKAGLQADVKVSENISLTGQVVMKQSTTDDERNSVQGDWLFGTYAVNDTTKIRAGKLRLPLFMMSEKLDVGKAYTLAKLPLEMYGQAPTNGYIGADVLKRFEVGDDAEVTVQPYMGYTRFDARVAGMMPDGSTLFKAFEATGLTGLNVVFDYNEVLRLRAGYMSTKLSYKDEANSMMGGMFAGMVNNVNASFSSLGAQLRLGDTTITGEYGQRRIDSIAFADTDGRYVSVDHKLGAVVPYISYSVISSDKSKMGGMAPNLEQSTKAAGVVYAVDSNSNIKAEASQVSVGTANNSNEFFNNGMAIAGKDIAVYRLNYNLMF